MTQVKINGFGVHLKVNDIIVSRKFYEDTVGMKPVFAYGDDAFRASIPNGVATAPERYRGVTYEPVPNCPFEIAEGHIAVSDPAVFSTDITSPKVSAMIRVGSLVPLFEAGVRPSFPVRHYYWGTLELAVRDPDGWVIVFVAPYSDGEMSDLQKFVGVEEIQPSA